MDGTKVGDILRSRKIKATTMAKAIGVADSVISKWLNGKDKLPQKHHQKVADFLNLSVADLSSERGEAIFDQAQMYEFISQLKNGDCIYVISPDGYKERTDPALFQRMVTLLKEGIRIYYYYPKNSPR